MGSDASARSRRDVCVRSSVRISLEFVPMAPRRNRHSSLLSVGGSRQAHVEVVGDRGRVRDERLAAVLHAFIGTLVFEVGPCHPMLSTTSNPVDLCFDVMLVELQDSRERFTDETPPASSTTCPRFSRGASRSEVDFGVPQRPSFAQGREDSRGLVERHGRRRRTGARQRRCP